MKEDGEGSNNWNIELDGLPFGILDDEVQKKFLNNDCSFALHHLQDETFRLTITSLEDEHIKTISIKLELEFDQDTFERWFEFYEHEDFLSAGQKVNLLKGETTL